MLKRDELDRVDIESAILTGKLRRIGRDEGGRKKYVIVGWATDRAREVGVVVKFKSRSWCAIITVYEISKRQD